MLVQGNLFKHMKFEIWELSSDEEQQRVQFMEKMYLSFVCLGILTLFPLQGSIEHTEKLSEKLKNQWGIGDPMVTLTDWQTA